MEVAIFLLRYVPFWAVPLAMISFEFAYVFWLKSMKRVSALFFVIFVIAMIFIGYYFWAGGSENSAKILSNFIYSHKQSD